MLKITFYSLLVMLIVTVNSVALAVMESRGFFDEPPYRDVVASQPIQLGLGQIEYRADFYKGPCDLVKFVVRGSSFGNTRVRDLVWIDLDGREENDDRLRGDTTLHGEIHYSPNVTDRIEIWTRHNCEGKKVDKLFDAIDLPLPS